MADRAYTFTFDGEGMDIDTTDGLLDEDQIANIVYWYITEVKPHAPLVALNELHYKITTAMRGVGKDGQD